MPGHLKMHVNWQGLQPYSVLFLPPFFMLTYVEEWLWASSQATNLPTFLIQHTDRQWTVSSISYRFCTPDCSKNRGFINWRRWKHHFYIFQYLFGLVHCPGYATTTSFV